MTAIARSLVLVVLAVATGCSSGDPVAERIAQLANPNYDVRIAAADALREMGAPAAAAVPELQKALADRHPTLRQASARALGKIGDKSASVISALRQSLQDSEVSVQLAAAWALHTLDRDGKHYIPVLKRTMESGEGGTIVAVGALGPAADWAVPTLTKLLGDRRPGVRRLAAEALAKIGPDPAARAVLEQRAQRDSDDRVRQAASAALK